MRRRRGTPAAQIQPPRGTAVKRSRSFPPVVSPRPSRSAAKTTFLERFLARTIARGTVAGRVFRRDEKSSPRRRRGPRRRRDRLGPPRTQPGVVRSLPARRPGSVAGAGILLRPRADGGSAAAARSQAEALAEREGVRRADLRDSRGAAEREHRDVHLVARTRLDVRDLRAA